MVIDDKVPRQFLSSLSLGRRRAETTHGLGDTLDVVTKDLAVTLGAALAEALATVHQVSARCDMPPTKKRKTNPFPRPDIVIECV